MFNDMLSMGSGGETALNPTNIGIYSLGYNVSQTVTIDASKHYIVTASYMLASYDYNGEWYIEDNVASEIIANGSLGSLSISGTTMTLTGLNVSYPIRFQVIQLD